MTVSADRPLRFSIVVATHNRVRLLQRTLPTLLLQDYPKSAYEVILVVDGSEDGTAQYARSLEAPCALEVLEQQHRGPAAARNAGIAVASGDIVLFMDDDIRCTGELLREHAEGHALGDRWLRVHGSIAVAPESPPTLAAWGTHEWYRRYDAELRAASHSDPKWSPYLNVNASVRTELLHELGGFDESIPFPREDFELAFRMIQAGVSFRYRPRALAYEIFVKSSSGYVKSGAGSGAAEVYISRKYSKYRPHCMLAPQDRDRPTPLRTAARRTLPRLPHGSETLLTPAVRAAERLIRRSLARSAGGRLLSLQHRIVLVRGARDAAGSAASLHAEFDRWLPVLMYHRVGEGTCGLAPQLTVTPRAFEQQIAWLARRGFTGIGPADWLAWREGRGTLPRKSLLITLDDAYAEIGLHALPVLRRYGFGALVFVVTGQLGGRNTWDPVYDHVRRPALMSARDVTYWARQGIEFGAHGRTHRDLRSLSGAELQGEICGSQHDLERILGAPVRWFSYPFGSYSVEAHALVAATYDLAFTVNEGLNGLSTDPHLLKRTMPGPGKRLLEIECRARLGRVPLSSARNMSRLRTRARTVGAAIASAGE